MTQKPILSVIFSQSFIYRITDSRHRFVNSAIPIFDSISFLSKIPSSFSISCSTGNPCVSHPAFLGTWYPCIVLYLGKASLKDLANTWCIPGFPFAVGGPSLNVNNGLSFERSSVALKTSFFSQKSRTSFSILGPSYLAFTTSNFINIHQKKPRTYNNVRGNISYRGTTRVHEKRYASRLIESFTRTSRSFLICTGISDDNSGVILG